MDDTRLLGIKTDAHDALIALYEIYRECAGDRTQTGAAVRAAFNAQRDAFGLLIKLMAPELPICGEHHCLGAKCYRHRDHEGAHKSDLGQIWTDDSNRRAGDAIAASFKAGYRD